MKTLALAQHLGLDVILFNGQYYVADINTYNEEQGADHTVTDFVSTVDEDNNIFLDWLETDCTLLSDELVEASYDDSRFEYGNQEYLVCTNDEADSEFQSSIENYVEECVLEELPEQYRRYFDTEAFIKDCSYDGRGNTLAGYDGHENEEIVGGETYYIYRTN